jgi:hypothetical protein
MAKSSSDAVERLARARALKATEKAAMSTKGDLSFAQVQAMKKKGTFKGFDGKK